MVDCKKNGIVGESTEPISRVFSSEILGFLSILMVSSDLHSKAVLGFRKIWKHSGVLTKVSTIFTVTIFSGEK